MENYTHCNGARHQLVCVNLKKYLDIARSFHRLPLLFPILLKHSFLIVPNSQAYIEEEIVKYLESKLLINSRNCTLHRVGAIFWSQLCNSNLLFLGAYWGLRLPMNVRFDDFEMRPGAPTQDFLYNVVFGQFLFIHLKIDCLNFDL